jgi:F0F1-type ATP synthase, beta subunit
MSNTGKIVQVIGPVVDIRFDADSLPSIKNAILIKTSEKEEMTAEVAQHIGDDIVRCIAMSLLDKEDGQKVAAYLKRVNPSVSLTNVEPKGQGTLKELGADVHYGNK